MAQGFPDSRHPWPPFAASRRLFHGWRRRLALRSLALELDDLNRMEKHGFDYHRIKPVDPDQLERLLSQGAESLSAGPDAFQGISP